MLGEDGLEAGLRLQLHVQPPRGRCTYRGGPELQFPRRYNRMFNVRHISCPKDVNSIW